MKFFITCGIFIVIFLLLYFVIFHSGLSNNSNDWGNFGSYIGGISTLILSAAAIYMTWNVFIKEQKAKKRQEVLKRVIERIDNIDKLRQEITILTKNNGFSKDEIKGIESRIRLQCKIIKSIINEDIQNKDEFLNSLEKYQKNMSQNDYENLVSSLSQLIEKINSNND